MNTYYTEYLYGHVHYSVYSISLVCCVFITQIKPYTLCIHLFVLQVNTFFSAGIHSVWFKKRKKIVFVFFFQYTLFYIHFS